MSQKSVQVNLQNMSYSSTASRRYNDVINVTNTSTESFDKDSSVKVTVCCF